MAADRLERVFTALLTTAATALALIAVRREFFPGREARSVASEPPTFEAAWKDAVAAGIRVGDSTARATIVVFSDLECPACRAFHQTTRRLLQENAKNVSVVFVHFPLPTHRFAVQAAQAAECASASGRFVNFIDAVYAKQDSLGLKSWGSYAREAGIADTAAIARCASDPAPVKRVEAGRELALRWELLGTPTVIINGLRYTNPPTKDELNRVIRDVLKGGGGVADRDESVPPASKESGVARAQAHPRVVLGDSDIVARNNLRVLFDGIDLSARQEAEAKVIIKRAFREQFAPRSGTVAEQVKRGRDLNVGRDSALKALLTSKSDQALFMRNATAWHEGRVGQSLPKHRRADPKASVPD